jgi:FMN phosphatase YigB (HAD superfamily)
MKRIKFRNPKFKWRVISFDFDETLAYLYPPIHETIGTILERHGIPGKARDIAEVLKDRSKQTRHPLLEERGWGQLTDEEQKEVLSHINRQILKQIGLASNLDFLANAINNEWFATRKLYPDVPQAIAQLKEMGMTITVVAGPTSAMIKEVLEKHNLLGYIECFATTDIVSLGLGPLNKLNGTAYLYVLERTKTKPQEVIHVGDNPRVDGEIPKSLGITPILINRSKRVDLEKAASGGFTVISNMQKLLKIIRREHTLTQ